MHLSSRGRAAILVALFIVSFVLRSYQPVSRPAQWLERSYAFDSAVSSGDWAATYQSRHPGFTGMVVGGITVHIYEMVQATPAQAIFSWAAPPFATPYGRQMAAGVMGMALVISGLIILSTILLSRLTDWLTALAAGGLMVFSPVYLTHSRVLHVDALVSSLMLTSALLILIYVSVGKLRYLLLSGLVAGLAILTKVPALFLLPFMGLALLVRLILRLRDSWGDYDEGRVRWVIAEVWRSLMLPGLMWIGMSLIPWALWPAMWVKPITVLQDMFAGTVQRVERSHLNPRFFAGQLYVKARPPATFYPAVLIYNTTFVALVFGVLAIAQYLFWPRRAEKPASPPIFWLFVAYIGFFVTEMAIAAKQVDRYILPAHVMLDVVAAVGLGGFVNVIQQAVKTTSRLALPALIASIAVGLQALSSVPYAPNYGAHHNYLFGANIGAVNMLEIMGQNEGANYVGEYLSQQPNATSIEVGTDWPLGESLGQYFAGDIKNTLSKKDYYIFNIAGMQRQMNVGGNWRKRWDEKFQYRTPQLVVRLGGVDYIWVFALDPDQAHDTVVINRGLLWMIPGSWIITLLMAVSTAWALRTGRQPDRSAT